MGTYFRYICGLSLIEYELYGRDYRCHAYLAADGSYHGCGTVGGIERLRTDEAFVEELPHHHAVQRGDGYGFLPHQPGGRGTVGTAGTYVAHHLRRIHRIVGRYGGCSGSFYQGKR